MTMAQKYMLITVLVIIMLISGAGLEKQ